MFTLEVGFYIFSYNGSRQPSLFARIAIARFDLSEEVFRYVLLVLC